MTNVIVGRQGEVILPEAVLNRYGFVPDIAIRVAETKGGVLLVPITDGPMSGSLADEVDACATTGDPTDLRFTSDLVLERIEALGDLFAPV